MPQSIPPAATVAGDDVMLRQRVSDPDFWLSVVCWTVVAWSVLQVTLFSFGRDQSIFAQVADTMLHGGMPYRDAWDFKPPGIYLVYALAHGVFGKTMVAPRLVEAIGMVAMVLAFRRFAFEVVGKRLPGHIGGAVACLVHAQLEFWHTGQPESFGGFITAVALMVTVRRWVKWRRQVAWAAVGVLFGLAFLLKPPLGGGAIVCAAYLVRREQADERPLSTAIQPLLIAGAASFVPIGLVALWFVIAGAWPHLYWTLFQFVPGYTSIGWGELTAAEAYYRAFSDAFVQYSSLTLTGVLAAIAIRPLHSREREGLFLVFGVVSIHLAGIAMQGKFFAYHYGASLQLLGLAAGVGFYKLWRRTLMSGPGGVLAYVAFVVVVANMRLAMTGDLYYPPPRPTFWQRSDYRLRFLFGRVDRVELDKHLYYVADYSLDANRLLAEEIRAITAADQPVFIWGFEPGVYWLAGREPSSRFIYNVAQRATWQRKKSRRSLMADLAERPPAAIAIQRGDRNDKVTGNARDSAAEVSHFPEFQALLRDHYVFVKQVDRFSLYKRK